jgi:hypothetical protein
VTVDVVVPESLSDAEREAVVELGDLMKGDQLREHLWSEQ